MPRYVAFLRAINVGGHVVKMETLRAHFSALGFGGVETFIASGNVIFQSGGKDAQAIERKIASYLQKVLGYAVATFVRTNDELQVIARHEAFPPREVEAEGTRLYIGFLASGLPPEALRKLRAERSETDAFHVHDREIHWLCRIPFVDSKYSGGLLERMIGVPVTFRNINTVRKLAAKYPA